MPNRLALLFLCSCVVLGLTLAPGLGAAREPLVVVVAQNQGTETTDFIIPFSILSRAGVRVEAVATENGPVLLHPGDMTLDVGTSLAQFDARHPEGADVVIVPAVMEPDDVALNSWIERQAGHGALMMSICDGAFVLAHAGLLDDRKATAHWYSRKTLSKEFPRVTWVDDRRYVEGESLITTTGVSASIPASLSLVERLAGTERALAVARDLDQLDYGPRHDSDAFGLKARHVGIAVWNWMRFWRHERVGIEIEDGVDELRLALMVDALARTWTSQPSLLSSTSSVKTRAGLIVETPPAKIRRRETLPAPGLPPVDATLEAIEVQYGRATANWVALQLEYARP